MAIKNALPIKVLEKPAEIGLAGEEYAPLESVMRELELQTNDGLVFARNNSLATMISEGSLSLGLYIDTLRQLALIYKGLELEDGSYMGLQEIVESSENETLNYLVSEYQMRGNMIMSDLEYLTGIDSTEGITPLPSTLKFLTHVNAMAELEPEYLAGVFYALEMMAFSQGSSRVEEFGIPIEATTYLQGHGRHEHDSFNGFKMRAVEKINEDMDKLGVVEMANRTFTYLANMYAQTQSRRKIS